MPRLLELFCGTKSVGRAFEAAGLAWTSCRNLSPQSSSGAGATRRFRGTSTWFGPAPSARIQPRADDAPAAAPGGRRAPLDVGHREPGHRAAEDPAVHGASALGGRDPLQVRNSVQEDAAVDQHALEAEAEPVQARQPLRHASCSTAFLPRCARRLRARPRRSLRSG